VQKALHKNGLLVNCTAGDVLRIVPPYVVTAPQVEQALQLLRATLATFPATAQTTAETATKEKQ
jgi:acetylornithine/N-succinyldiaminopimelate aminotransferase